jgi:hypothetical protein
MRIRPANLSSVIVYATQLTRSQKLDAKSKRESGFAVGNYTFCAPQYVW